MGLLGRLRLLMLRDNQLTELPPSLASCTSLIELHAGGRRPGCCGCCAAGLAGLAGPRARPLPARSLARASSPPSEARLPRRAASPAGFNQLSRLPEELAHCRALRTLDLRNNKVSDYLGACCTLELNLLDLTNNSIR